jgi:hypothetical protein
VPTSCSLSVFYWATTLPDRTASPNAVIAAIPRMLSRFMVFSFAVFAKLLGARATGFAHMPICRCRRHPQYKPGSIFKLELCPPMAPELLTGGSGDFGTSPFLGSSQSRQSACQHLCIWGTGIKVQWRSEK